MNAALTCGVLGTAVNAVHAIAKGHDPFPVLMAGTILTVLFVGLQPSGLGAPAAGIFLLGSFIVNGTSTINLLTKLEGSK